MREGVFQVRWPIRIVSNNCQPTSILFGEGGASPILGAQELWDDPRDFSVSSALGGVATGSLRGCGLQM